MTPMIPTTLTAVVRNASHAQLVNSNPLWVMNNVWTVRVENIQLKLVVFNVKTVLHMLRLNVVLLSARAMQGPRVITINALCVRLASTRMKRDPLLV